MRDARGGGAGESAAERLPGDLYETVMPVRRYQPYGDSGHTIAASYTEAIADAADGRNVSVVRADGHNPRAPFRRRGDTPGGCLASSSAMPLPRAATDASCEGRVAALSLWPLGGAYEHRSYYQTALKHIYQTLYGEWESPCSGGS